jgi:long-subunit acyl-CoA synthetase (AMP-forming)
LNLKGQTETASGATMTHPGDKVAGHVGAPFLSCEVKLKDIPELDYYTHNEQNPNANPQGEVNYHSNILTNSDLRERIQCDEKIFQKQRTNS